MLQCVSLGKDWIFARFGFLIHPQIPVFQLIALLCMIVFVFVYENDHGDSQASVPKERVAQRENGRT